MAQTNFTPILLYASSTPTNAPSAGNLTNSATGSEIAINIADKNLFFKDSTNAVNTVPIRQSSTSSNGWLSSTDWNTFNNKSNTNGTVTSVAATVPAFLSIAGSPITTNGTLAITLSGTALPVANGGTGLTTLTAGYIPYGNGTSAFGSSSNLFWNSSTSCLGVGLVNGTSKLEVAGAGANNAGARATYEGSIKINEAGSFDLQTTGGLEFKGSVFASGYGSKIFSTDNGTMLFGVRQNSASWTETMRIHGSTGVSIGNTADPGVGSLNVNKNILIGTSTAPDQTTNGQIALGNALVIQTANNIAAGGTLDLTINTATYAGSAGAWAGILSVCTTRGNFAPQATHTVYALVGYGTTFTATSLATQNGASGGSAFTLTSPSAGVIRLTDTSGSGSDIYAYMHFSGTKGLT